MDGTFVGHLSLEDPLYEFLTKILSELGATLDQLPRFRVFRLRSPHEVYGYHEKYSDVRLVCKFYGSRFAGDDHLAAIVAEQEFNSLNTLRGYGFVGSPHHVVAPLGLREEINCALVVEYYSGEELTYAIRRATHHGDRAHLLARLKALAGFMSAQHAATKHDSLIDFRIETNYFDSIVEHLYSRGRLSQEAFEDLAAIRDEWSARPEMWRDNAALIHGDATPGNFLFGVGDDVAAIDLERMRWGDPMFDVGRIAGELQHSFMLATSRKSYAEPFISHLFAEYSARSEDPVGTFESLTVRARFFMAVTHLRIARNEDLGIEYRDRLIRQARRLLDSP